MKLFTLLVASYFCVIAVAQAQPKIYIKASDDFFPSFQLVTKNKEISFIAMGSSNEMIELFKDNEISYQHIKEYQSNSSWSRVSLWGSIAFSLFYLASDTDNFSRGTYWGIFGTGLFGSIYFQGKARRSFYKAINTYNEVPNELSFDSKKTQAPKLTYSWSF